jgi:hypothetical protein
MHQVFKAFVALVHSEDPSVMNVFKKRVAPIEFIFIALLISVLGKRKGKVGISEMAEKVGEMRDYVRKRRSNSSVGRALMEFVRSGEARRQRGKRRTRE